VELHRYEETADFLLRRASEVRAEMDELGLKAPAAWNE